jgi:hypothetical protein
MKAIVTVNRKATEIEAKTLKGLKMKAVKISNNENTIFMTIENGDRYSNEFNGKSFNGWGAKLA